MALVRIEPSSTSARMAAINAGCFYAGVATTGGTQAGVAHTMAGLRPGLRWRSDGVPGFRRSWTAPNDKKIPIPVKNYPLANNPIPAPDLSMYEGE